LVEGAAYVPIWVSVGIDVVPGDDTAAVVQRVKLSIRQFLAALPPYGPTGNGWPMGRAVDGRELEVIAARESGVAGVNGHLLGCASGGSVDPILLRPTELPELTSLAVQVGEPQTREEMLAGPIKSAPVKATAQAPAQQPPKPTATPSPGYC